jgi:ubiquinol oxidase
VSYYCGSDLAMFDNMHISPEAVAAPRRPVINNLYDVFTTIAEDEIEHQKTMTACQDPVRVARDIAQAQDRKG